MLRNLSKWDEQEPQRGILIDGHDDSMTLVETPDEVRGRCTIVTGT
jgi:hypothetical protein